MSTHAAARRLALATASIYPDIHPDDAHLAFSLEQLGLQPRVCIWNDPDVDWSQFDAVLIRTVWDYFQHYAAFRHWLDDEFLSNTVFGLTCRLGHRIPAAIKPVNAAAARALGSRTYIDAAYRVFTSPRRVRFKEQEYAIPRASLADALGEVRSLLRRKDWRISFPIEVRVAPRDDLWLSTGYGRDSAYIAVHVFHADAHEDYFRGVEEVMTAVGGRPHWGKMHTRDAGYLRREYPRFSEFLALRDALDPERRFGNAYLEQVLGS